MWDKIMCRLKLILSVGNVITTNQTTQTVDFAHGEVPENIKYAQGYGIEVTPCPAQKRSRYLTLVIDLKALQF
jgi:hypothetical protein